MSASGRSLLDELGDQLDKQLWANGQNVELARHWIADESQPAPSIFRLEPPTPTAPSSRPHSL